MSEVAVRYRRLCDDFADKVSRISPERWSAPFPDADGQTKLLALLGRHV